VTRLDLRVKVTLNDHNQLLSRFTRVDSGATFATPVFSVAPFSYTTVMMRSSRSLSVNGDSSTVTIGLVVEFLTQSERTLH